MSERYNGVVQFYDPEMNFGFIRPDKARADIFVHASELGESAKHLQKGDAVSFEIVPSKKRVGAINAAAVEK